MPWENCPLFNNIVVWGNSCMDGVGFLFLNNPPSVVPQVPSIQYYLLSHVSERHTVTQYKPRKTGFPPKKGVHFANRLSTRHPKVLLAKTLYCNNFPKAVVIPSSNAKCKIYPKCQSKCHTYHIIRVLSEDRFLIISRRLQNESNDEEAPSYVVSLAHGLVRRLSI